MNAISSYVRHLIVAGILLLLTKYKLPLEGADQAADAVALLVIGTVTWAAVKYAPPGLSKFLGFSMLALLAGGLSSCVPGAKIPISASISYEDPATGAAAGLTYTPRLRVMGSK